MADELFSRTHRLSADTGRREALRAVRELAEIVQRTLPMSPSAERIQLRDLIAALRVSLGETLNATDVAWEVEDDETPGAP